MLEFKGIRGPWKINKVSSEHIHIGVEQSSIDYKVPLNRITKFEPLCTVSSHFDDRKFGWTEEEIEANAAIIAAAPELLEVLQEVLELVHSMYNDQNFPRAKAVIKKALNIKT